MSPQIVHFDLPFVAELATHESTQDVELVMPGPLKVSMRFSPLTCRGPVGNYSREIQQGARATRLHIPVLDRRAWLCVDFMPTQSSPDRI